MASILNVILRVTGQSSLGGTFTGLNQGLQLADAAVSALNDTVGAFIRQGIQMNSFLESSELQFKTLTGSATAAHDQLAMLVDLAAHSPFTFESVTVASRQLEVYGGAALDTRDNLVLLGDAAAATGAPIQEVTFWTGRLYAQLQAGKPIGEASRWLQRMGVLSAEARLHMEDLAASGASANEIWKAFTDSQQRFSGAMKEQERTWVGLTSTMQDTFAILEGVATKGLFTTLEGQVKGLNAALADPRTLQTAQDLGDAIGEIAAASADVGGFVIANSQIVQLINAYQGLLDVGDRVFGRKPEALVTTSGAIMAGVDAARTYTAALEDVAEAQSVTNRVLGAAKVAGDSASRSYDVATASWHALTSEAGMLSATQAQQGHIMDALTEDIKEQTEALLAQGQALAAVNQQGDQFSRHPPEPPTTDADIQRAQQQREAFLKQIADAEERNRRQAAENEKATFDATADAIREKNQQTADAIRDAQQASQEAVRRAYGETADEAERAFARVRDAAAPPVDTLSQQLNEATNRQVREGIAGTTEAEKELDDIRRAHLATLPDLVALDQQYAAAQSEVHTADVALAAAQRNLAVALAASGGQQTLHTAALQHDITAAEAAAAAARAHSAELSQERSQAISDTSALRGLAAQRASMGGGGGGGLLLQDTGSQAGRTHIYGMPFIQPTYVTNNITNHGPVGVDDLGRQITDTVNNGLRNGAVRVPGLATR